MAPVTIKDEYDVQGLPTTFGLARLKTRDGEFRTNSRSMLAIYRKDLSYHPENSSLGKSRYVTITTFRLKLGQEADFMAGSKLFTNAYEKIHFPRGMAAYQVIGGVPSGMILFIEPLESLKAMDSMPEVRKALREAMGQEQWGRLMKGAADVFLSIENSFFRISPQMSYVSKETEDADPAFWRPKAPAKPAAEAKPKEKPGT